MLATMPQRDLNDLLARLDDLVGQGRAMLRRDSAGEFFVDGSRYEIPRLIFRGPSEGQSPIRLGIFAGLHGDEPAGGEALVLFLAGLIKDPSRAQGYELYIYPVTNPTGYEDNTRSNRAGKDLNREFWRDSAEPEVAILEAELKEHRFFGIIALHADDTCTGLYGYAHDRLLNEALLRPALKASERILPRDQRAMIDGWSAQDGVINQCFCGVLAAPLDQKPQPFDVIFETPALEPLDVQARAASVALQTILDEYRGFIAQGQDL
ncbi:MAG: M14 family zinc carboxypeptidase [Nibricoccus sp.]